MTELSPAQKALAAFKERHELCGPFDSDWVEQCLADALDAVANLMKMDNPLGGTDADAGVFAAHHAMRSQLLDIAAELRGNTPTENNLSHA